MLREHRGSFDRRALGVIIVLATLLTLALPLSSPTHFLSPDETANFAFATHIATNGTTAIPEPLNSVAENGVHPRSMVVKGDTLLPASFVVFPFVLGTIGRVLTVRIIPFITALFYAIAIAGVWIIGRRWFGARAGLLSALLFTVQPLLLYYAAHGLWHNGILAYSLVIGLAFWELSIERERAWLFVLGTTFWLFAIAIRPNEAGLLIILGGLLLWSRSVLRKRTLLLGGLCSLITLVGLFNLQRWVFGSFSSFGYNAITTTDGEGVAVVNRFLPYVRQLFFPFGFHPVQAFRLMSQFAPHFAQPLSALVVIGLVGWWRASQRGDRRRVIIIALLVAALYLGVSYGSYSFSESFDGQVVVLGSSYARYWLPAIMLLTPFAGYGAFLLLSNYGWRKNLWAAFVSLTVILSLSQVFLDSRYGIVKEIRQDLAVGARQRAEALPLIPIDAVVVTGSLDKVFFPERRVIGSNYITEKQFKEMSILAQANVPVYLVTTSPTERTAADAWFVLTEWRLQTIRQLSGNAVLSALTAKTS